MNRLPSYVYYLLLGQGINLITAVLSVTIAAIVGLNLAPDSSYATIPYGLQFFAILVSTLFFSGLMKKFGRYPVFLFGTLSLFLSGIVGFFAVYTHHFLLLCGAHFLLGLFISTANFYRFAATDGLEQSLIPKATSMVISGGVLAALIAPFLAIHFEKVNGMPQYSCIYLILSVLSFVLLFILFQWKIKYQAVEVKKVEVQKEIQEDVSPNYHLIAIGFLGGALGYYLMNLMMIVFSLYLKTNHSFHFASVAIQMHVLAMFLPSFFVPKLIQFLGDVNTIIFGFFLIVLSSVIPIFFQEALFLNISLIILGLGWNFCYSAGSALVGGIKGAHRIKVQGLNETGIALFATLGAFLPAPILSTLGWIPTNILTVVFGSVIIVFIIVLKVIMKRKGYVI